MKQKIVSALASALGPVNSYFGASRSLNFRDTSFYLPPSQAPRPGASPHGDG